MIKAILFDLDGTLLDTLDDLADSANAMLAGRGHPPHPVDAYRRFVGDGMATLVERTHPHHAVPSGADLQTAVRTYQAEYSRRWKDKSRPYPGLPGLLATLSAQGKQLGVVSNKAQSFTELCVNHFFPEIPWGVVIGQRDGIPHKPHPAGALEAAGILGVEPGECVFVGDSGIDMRTACAAGMIPAGVLWGFREAEELTGAGALHLVKDASALEALLLA